MPTSAVRVRYFAGAAAAAGTEEEVLDVPAGATAADLAAVMGTRHPRLLPVLEVATLLVDGLAAREPTTPVGGATLVDVLPPFAGG